MAAMALAMRVSDELAGRERPPGDFARSAGGPVGFLAPPFGSGQPGEAGTCITYLTEEALAREALADPLLRAYSVVMVDEVHERSLHADLALGLLRKVLLRRPQLRVVVSSATLDADALVSFFGGEPRAAALWVGGRPHPVEVMYVTRPVRDYVVASAEAVARICDQEPPGGVLVFLPTRDDVARCTDLLREAAVVAEVLPLHSGLGGAEQFRVLVPPSLAPGTRRRVVISTNLAETSLTLPGISYVVDSGFVRLPSFDPRAGVGRLATVPVSRSAARQRAGRAGRTGPGRCYRLYTERAYLKELPERTVPEILRSDLSGFVLRLKSLGVRDVLGFPFLDPPHPRQLVRALDTLHSLGALDGEGRLTRPRGLALAEVPLEPRLGLMLVAGLPPRAASKREEGSEGAGRGGQAASAAGAGAGAGARAGTQAAAGPTDATVTLVAALASRPHQVWGPRLGAGEYAVHEGDHLTLLNVVRAFVAAGQSAAWCRDRGFNHAALREAADLRKALFPHSDRWGPILLGAGGGGAGGGPDAEEGDDDPDDLRRCVAQAFFEHAAQLQPDGTYRTVRGQARLEVHPASVLHRRAAPWVVFHDVEVTSARYMRVVSRIEPQWLAELAPGFYRSAPAVGPVVESAGHPSALALPAKRHRELF